jgi:transcriptional regulator with XRE-family HTH domain
MTQKQLAEKMNCSQQYISKILKGKENLSLETLSKIEDALGIQILTEDTVLYTQLCSE